jgi:hypothetical protein
MWAVIEKGLGYKLIVSRSTLFGTSSPGIFSLSFTTAPGSSGSRVLASACVPPTSCYFLRMLKGAFSLVPGLLLFPKSATNKSAARAVRGNKLMKVVSGSLLVTSKVGF